MSIVIPPLEKRPLPMLLATPKHPQQPGVSAPSDMTQKQVLSISENAITTLKQLDGLLLTLSVMKPDQIFTHMSTIDL